MCVWCGRCGVRAGGVSGHVYGEIRAGATWGSTTARVAHPRAVFSVELAVYANRQTTARRLYCDMSIERACGGGYGLLRRNAALSVRPAAAFPV